MERCWHGKFTGSGQCFGEGRYGNPNFHRRPDRPALDAPTKFMRAARWCAAHKHRDDALLGPSDYAAAAPERDAVSAERVAAR